MSAGAPRPGRRQRRLGQNFLADSNLLELIVRESGTGPDDVVLEVGGGGGALTERLSPQAGFVHVVELDSRLVPELRELAAELGNVEVTEGDALKLDLASLDPPPVRLVSNLPYSIATPLLLRTLELPRITDWLAMVQAEVAERLAAAPGTKAYGSPSAVAGLSCEVELVRKVNPAVFTPRPRVGSALVRMRRTGPPPSREAVELIRSAFAHRRKSLARSLDLSRPGSLAPARAALEELGHPPGARAESLAPDELAALAERLRPAT